MVPVQGRPVGAFLDGEPKGGKRSDEATWRSLNHQLDRAGYGIVSVRHGRTKMPEEPPSSTLDRELISTIVAAYVRQNQITSAQLGALISTVHQVLSGLGKPAADTEGERTPAVPIRRSVHRDYVVCLECGWRGQMLKWHLATGHGLSVEQYRARWNLTREHAMTAPGYSERRSTLALEFGLGRTRGGSAETTVVPEAVAETAPPPSPKRRGRPRTARS
jgi:predicted transcriptional regulator